MDSKLTFEYDRIGDTLYINKCTPYPEKESAEIEYGVVASFHPKTNEIENLEVMFFWKRLSEKTWFELPINADFSLVGLSSKN